LRLFAGDVVVNNTFVRSGEADALQIIGSREIAKRENISNIFVWK
jgi:hypothetical protein